MTDNLERQIAFYRDGLGLPIRFKFINSDGELFGVYFDCGDTSYVEIFDRKGAAKQWGGDPTPPLQSGTQYHHLCLEAVGLPETREALMKRGVNFGEIKVGIDNSLQMWAEDPDGNKLEIMEYTHRSWQLQPPAQ